jgi:hypothetical protein
MIGEGRVCFGVAICLRWVSRVLVLDDGPFSPELVMLRGVDRG